MILQDANIQLIGPKAAAETKTATFDFSGELATGAAIVSATVSIAWAGGTYDANPSAVLNGGSAISGSGVLQSLTGGLGGAVYKLVATATDDSAETHTIEAQLVIEPALTAGTVPWADMAHWVLEHAKECALPIIERQLAHAARLFCEQSNVWRSERITLLTTAAGVRLYSAPLQANAEVYRVYEAWVGTTEVAVELPGQNTLVSPSEPNASTWTIGTQDQSLLRLTPPPATTGQVVTGTLVYMPAQWALGLPEPIYRRWGHEIAHGAAADLVVQAGKPWSDRNAYAWLAASFKAAAGRASFDAGPVHHSSGGLRVKPC